MQIVLVGGTGFIGRAMVQAWAQQHRVVVLTREVAKARQRLPNEVECVSWDGQNLGEWVAVLEGADGLVNLAGEPIAQRWTPAVKQRLRQSRLHPTRLLMEAIGQLRTPPATLLQASAIGIYDQNPTLEVDESSPPGKGFLAELCVEWEAAARPAESVGVRSKRCCHPSAWGLVDPSALAGSGSRGFTSMMWWERRCFCWSVPT
jgi:uncharacterized protein (TIGR01777 family)